MVVQDKVLGFADTADGSEWYPSEFGSASLVGHCCSEGVPRFSRMSNPRGPGARVLSCVVVLPLTQQSRCIGSLGGFMDHHMRTCLLFVIGSFQQGVATL